MHYYTFSLPTLNLCLLFYRESVGKPSKGGKSLSKHGNKVGKTSQTGYQSDKESAGPNKEAKKKRKHHDEFTRNY